MKGFLEMPKQIYQKKRKPAIGGYQGILAKPMVLPIRSALFPQKEYDQFVASLYDVRLKALYKHYKIDFNSPFSSEKLIMALAMDHVPGFKPIYPEQKPKNKIGKPPIWTEAGGIELYVLVQGHIKESKSVLGACRILSKLPSYKKCAPESLKQRYYEVIRRWGKGHRKNIDSLIDLIPSKNSMNLLMSYAPDGKAIFNDPLITEKFLEVFSKP